MKRTDVSLATIEFHDSRLTCNNPSHENILDKAPTELQTNNAIFLSKTCEVLCCQRAKLAAYNLAANTYARLRNMPRKAARSNDRSGVLAASPCASHVSIDLSLKRDT